MGAFYFPILSVLIYVPLLGAVVLLFVRREHETYIKGFTLVLSLIEFALSIPLFFYFDDKSGGHAVRGKGAVVPGMGNYLFSRD